MNPVKNCPFGVLFAEPSIVETELPQSSYDDERDISMTEDDEGKLVPLVTSLPWTLGTFTETRVMGEHTDAD